MLRRPSMKAAECLARAAALEERADKSCSEDAQFYLRQAERWRASAATYEYIERVTAYLDNLERKLP